jgi:hypothetical protein
VNAEEAKSILAIYRPNIDDREDPAVAEALRLAESDPELKRWCDEHWAAQNTLRRTLRTLPVPDQLKQDILGSRPPLNFPMPAKVWLALAAGFILLGVIVWLLRPASNSEDTFENYRDRMVRDAIRQYQMDIVTHDATAIRTFLSTNNAPHDYVLPAGLQRLQTTGAGLLAYRSQPVSMVCFDRGDGKILFLFVTDRKAVRDEPPQAPQFKKISRLSSVSWVNGHNTYLLAGPEEAQFEEKYLKP